MTPIVEPVEIDTPNRTELRVILRQIMSIGEALTGVWSDANAWQDF